MNVKKRVTLLLLFAYLMGATPLGEIVKLPVLLGHYLEHSPDGSLSFTEFLKIHYDENQPHHAHESHGDLPFKSYSSLVITDLVHPPSIAIQAFRTSLCLERSDNFSASVYTYSSKFQTAIWQPPRIC